MPFKNLKQGENNKMERDDMKYREMYWDDIRSPVLRMETCQNDTH